VQATGTALALISTMDRVAGACIATVLAVNAPFLLGCRADIDLFERTPITIQTCTVVGCVDTAVVTLQGLPFDDGSTLPIEVEVCREGDGACRYAEIGATEAWVETAPGLDCFSQEADRLCCTYAPGSFHSCIPFPSAGIRLALTLQESVWVGAKHTVAVSARSAAGESLLDGTATIVLDVYQPNGPECEPTCFRGEAVLP